MRGSTLDAEGQVAKGSSIGAGERAGVHARPCVSPNHISFWTKCKDLFDVHTTNNVPACTELLSKSDSE